MRKNYLSYIYFNLTLKLEKIQQMSENDFNIKILYKGLIIYTVVEIKITFTPFSRENCFYYFLQWLGSINKTNNNNNKTRKVFCFHNTIFMMLHIWSYWSHLQGLIVYLLLFWFSHHWKIIHFIAKKSVEIFYHV